MSKKRRDNGKIAEAQEKLEELARSGENVMLATVGAVRAYAIVGEVTDVGRRLCRLWTSPVRV